ncbi:MAG: AAA family ATPase [Chloroflexi bacterium]|nr:AAA family ATPase [Chloroflexota bacterium]
MTTYDELRRRLRVPVEELTVRIDESALGFASTSEIAPLEGTIGQDRALRALEFGLSVGTRGFNTFVAGLPGSGRNTTLAGYLKRVAETRPVPSDWVYVNNFRDQMKPRGIRMEAGMGRRLAADMAALVVEVKARLPRAFESEEYKRRIEGALQALGQQHRKIVEDMVAEGRRRNIGLTLTDAGVIAAHLGPDGKALSPEQLRDLAADDLARIHEQEAGLQEYIAQQTAALRRLDREESKVRRDVSREVANFSIAPLFAELEDTYAGGAETLAYLAEVREDMVANLQLFFEADGAPAGPGESAGPDRGERDPMARYGVNVFVDHSATAGAPVVFSQNPSYYNVFGKVDHVFRMGVMSTDFAMIRAGEIHRANGGFLVFQAKDLLSYPVVWGALKRALASGEARVETLGEQFAAVPTTSLEPEPVPLDVKVVLIGNPALCRMLRLYDEDYGKLFKVKADFGYDMDIDEDAIASYASFIARRVEEEGLPHFDRSGVARLIEHSSRLVEDKHKLTTQFGEVAELITEAAYWAREAGHDLVAGEDVVQAVAERRHRSNLVEERLQELHETGAIRVDVEGESVGQVNGLAVIDMGDYSFGRPSRVSARVGLGWGDVANVEQASGMSGRIHTKGFAILTGYLMGKYGRSATLPIRASITFEQTYEEIDGDSAASTELYALLSSLTGVPIKQGYAVTGSVDQQGRVQAVGGVTRKVEGFFQVCEAHGLTGEQGVLLPAANVRNLVLDRDVVEAVEAGRFHIYAIETIEEGIELLTGVSAGEADEEGAYPEDSINALVVAALARMSEQLRAPELVDRGSAGGARGAPSKAEDGGRRDPREGPGDPPATP